MILEIVFEGLSANTTIAPSCLSDPALTFVGATVVRSFKLEHHTGILASAIRIEYCGQNHNIYCQRCHFKAGNETLRLESARELARRWRFDDFT